MDTYKDFQSLGKAYQQEKTKKFYYVYVNTEPPKVIARLTHARIAQDDGLLLSEIAYHQKLGHHVDIRDQSGMVVVGKV